jgi:uncharacterized protein YjbI with pentapeptide repeats
MMLYSSTAIARVWIAVLSAIASNSSPSLVSQSPPFPSSNSEQSVCYIQTQEGQIQDLSRLCGAGERNSIASPKPIQQLLTTKQCSRCALGNANLIGANLRVADLMSANLSNAKLTRATLMFSDLRGAALDRADLQGANLYGADLTGANLQEANLKGANLKGAILNGANLRGAIMPDGTTYR